MKSQKNKCGVEFFNVPYKLQAVARNRSARAIVVIIVPTGLVSRVSEQDNIDWRAKLYYLKAVTPQVISRFKSLSIEPLGPVGI
jgi:hypothetical protein